MEDTELLNNINKLVEEEHELMKQAEGGQLDETKQARMHELEIKLDQCWDLLRQRRARREFGLNPEEATLRDENIVEHYQQ
ncbi:MAG TPA: DUF2630 domain-containing protein [Ktedonobacter sp.]|jgi:hypothetical protein|nr:DUF2630 domain-containing protein [Ktedonobacter sp.]HBE26682.1 DUF2630 domain-containing protein [Ktedonobacter sp.]HCF85228.1 DUF2630 domain-containing protein [Ktedonobacter sp.]